MSFFFMKEYLSNSVLFQIVEFFWRFTLSVINIPKKEVSDDKFCWQIVLNVIWSISTLLTLWSLLGCSNFILFHQAKIMSEFVMMNTSVLLIAFPLLPISEQFEVYECIHLSVMPDHQNSCKFLPVWCLFRLIMGSHFLEHRGSVAPGFREP